MKVDNLILTKSLGKGAFGEVFLTNMGVCGQTTEGNQNGKEK